MKRTFTKYPVTASQERGTVQTYRNRRNPNKYIEVKKGNDGHSYARQYMEWDSPNGKVKNYTGAKDAKRGRYSRARRATIDQMLEDYDAVQSSETVDWLSQHDQAYEDAVRFFGTDDLNSVPVEELEGWISEHDQLWNDYVSYFGIEEDDYI